MNEITLQTKLIHNDSKWDKATGALSVAIQPASTFHQFDLENFGNYDYARSGNPTREALENLIAQLEAGYRGFAFSSGMAAISTTLLMFNAGDHLIITEDVYGGTHRVVTKILTRFNIEHTFVDLTDTEKIKDAIKPNTRAIYIETPSNPTLKETDIKKVCQIAKNHNLLTIVDNTFLTPIYQRPLKLGADIVLHSATKFLAGHSDVVAGLVVVNDEEIASKIYFLQNALGAVLGPNDSWLVIRGMKTLHVRMEKASKSAKKIASFLNIHPLVKKVYYPKKGAVLSFELNDYEAVKTFHRKIKLPAFAVSLGGVESILSYPAKMSHAAMSEKERLNRGITNGLIRLSVGLENVDDLISDLNFGLSNL